jgi:ribonucleotide reductase beta subunit family protein with ferritin-like domain
MKNIGLPELFPNSKNNIKGWLDNWFGTEGQFVQVAPQEIEVLSYKIGASSNDLDSMEF